MGVLGPYTGLAHSSDGSRPRPSSAPPLQPSPSTGLPFSYALGTYTFHPSNLASGEGRGPGPIESAVEERRLSVPTACHHVDEGFDTGHVVGTGRDTRIVDAEGRHLSIGDICFALGPEGARMGRKLLAAIRDQRAVIYQLDFA